MSLLRACWQEEGRGEGRLERRQFLMFCSGESVIPKIKIAAWVYKDRQIPAHCFRAGQGGWGTETGHIAASHN